MARTKITLNHGGVAAVLKSAGVRADLTSRAERVLAAAVAEGKSFEVTGNYWRGLAIRQDTTDRVAVRVVGTAPHTHLVEANHGTLARALDAAR